MHIKHTPQFDIRLDYHRKPALDTVLRYCKDQHLFINNLRVIGTDSPDMSVYTAVISLHTSRDIDREKILGFINKVPGVQNAQMESIT